MSALEQYKNNFAEVVKKTTLEERYGGRLRCCGILGDRKVGMERDKNSLQRSTFMYNPFRPGNGIEPPYVAGRMEYLQEFSRALDLFEEGLPRNFIIFGPRGTGKTVLVNLFGPIARQKGWHTISREFNSRFCDEERFADAVITDLVNEACNVSFISQIKKRGELLLDTLKPEEISAHGIRYKPFYKKKRVLLEDHLKRILIENWNVFKKAGVKGVVLLYDEFHTVHDGKNRGDYPLASFLGAVAQAQREGCRYVLVLSGLPNLPLNLKEAKTYTERMFVFRELGNLPEGEARRAIQLPLKGSGHKFEKKLVDEIIKKTGGYPYFLQFYGYFVIETLKKELISLSDLARMRTRLLRELDISFFEDRFKKATCAEQEILLAMAAVESNSIAPTEIIKATGIGKSTFFMHLQNLANKNLIYRASRGAYSFSIPLFKEFLVRKKKGMERS